MFCFKSFDSLRLMHQQSWIWIGLMLSVWHPVALDSVAWGRLIADSSDSLDAGKAEFAGKLSEDFYLEKIWPVLQSKCFACHSGLKQEAGLRLDARQWMQAGGDSGSTLGDASQSLLFERITADDSWRMPPAKDGAALRSEEIEDIRLWLNSGAPVTQEPQPISPENHWAFLPLNLTARRGREDRRDAIGLDDVQLPVIDGLSRPKPDRLAAESNVGSKNQSTLSAHPVDALVARLRSRQGFVAANPVPQHLLIRRLYLDLIGLPPTAQQLVDSRSVEEIADELLASPQYGIRWGRHWMDIWRYTDWYGLGEQLRHSQKHMWHWRDWIIDSLNADKGYDRMILEMLAGDELEPENPEAIAATGFLARNYYLFNRTTWLDDTIEHTAKAFLGLTLNCAKCHDHKYDPISQVDYYNWRAFFEPHQVRLDPVPGVNNLDQDGLPRAFDDNLAAETRLHRRGDPAQPDTETEIKAQIPALFVSSQPTVEEVALPVSAYAPGTRSEVRHSLLQAARDRLTVAQADFDELASGADNDIETSINQGAVQIAEARLAVAQQAIRSLQATIEADDIQFGLSVGDLKLAASAARREQRELKLAEARLQLLHAADDEAKQKSAKDSIATLQQQADQDNAESEQYVSLKVSRKALETPEHTDQDYPAAYSPTSSGRRLTLARWIASPENPLTARVAVNHIWMRHFGEPLVENVFDFGLRTEAPEQLELLDFLAARFIESGWSMKHIHKLLVTSELYRLGDVHYSDDEFTRQSDADNRFWWRGNVRRMESQVIRDCLLEMAGWLDHTMGGPPELVGPGVRRRSVYFKHSRDDQDQFLQMFDDADILQCYRRSESIAAQQPLALSNSQLALEACSGITARITEKMTDPADDAEFIESAFVTVLARPPSSDEFQVCSDFLLQMQQVIEKAEVAVMRTRARERLILSLVNHNDFISIR
jgi:hypothetical protein